MIEHVRTDWTCDVCVYPSSAISVAIDSPFCSELFHRFSPKGGVTFFLAALSGFPLSPPVQSPHFRGKSFVAAGEHEVGICPPSTISLGAFPCIGPCSRK